MNKAVRVIFIFFFFGLVIFLSISVYQSYAESKNVPREVQNSPDFQIALRNAERVRFVEFGMTTILFPMVAFGMAFYRFPRVSWLRSILAAAITFLPVFVIFSKQMESTFQQTFPSAPLPLTALQTAGVFAATGILFTGTVFLLTERIHVWRVGR